MKKLVTVAILFAAVAILGNALTRAANDKQPSPGEPTASETSAKSTKSCCQATGITLAKTDACSGDSCKTGEQPSVGCKSCPKGESQADCVTCAATKDTADPVAASTKKGTCCTEGNCKQQCSRCAEANKESASTDSAAAVTHTPGRGMGHGRGMGNGQGMRRGQGMGHGHAADSQHDKDHQDFFFLIEHRDSIRRTVKNTANGIESLTESDVPEVAEMIQVHVEAMYERVEHSNPIRMRDPIFRAIFANADKIQMNVEHTEKGVRVTETSTDAYVVKLLQEHAKVVSLWIKNGYAELPKNHPAPKQ